MNDSSSPHVVVLSSDPGIRWNSPKGAAVHLRSITAGLRALGLRVSVATPDGIARSFTDDGQPTFSRYRGGPSVMTYYRSLDVGRVSTELRAIALNPLMLDGLRELHHHHPITAIYERHSLWGDAGARLSEELDVPLVLEVNAPLIREQMRYRSLVLRDVAEAVRTTAMNQAARIITVSRVLAAELTRDGIPRDRLLVLPNIAERAAYADVTYTPPESGSSFIIGFSGTFKPWHGLPQFLEVFRLVHAARPQVRLEILGSGKSMDEVTSWTRAHGLEEAIRFHGHLPHEEVPGVLVGWHLAVAPYPDLDDFYFSPLKIAEALTAGRPVVASRLGDIPEMLDQGQRGVLIPASDWEGWVTRLIQLVDDPTPLVAMAENAERATRSWSWREQARRSLDGLGVLTGEEVARA